MIIFPAIDIKMKRCVRLKKGKAEEETVFSQDPVAMAKHWEGLGAKWLHVADLDGAFEGDLRNFEVVDQICSETRIPVQLGGGIRSLSAAKKYFEAGVDRIIIGTLALEDYKAMADLCKEYPQKVGVSLDAEDSLLKSKGWVNNTQISLFDVLPGLQYAGVAFIVYTDITRDGMQTGVNMDAVQNVVKNAELPVIAAGGVSSLEDVQALYPLHTKGLSGIIVGKAIYSGNLDLKQAVQWVDEQAA